MAPMYRHRKLLIYSKFFNKILGRLKNKLRLRDLDRRVNFYENIEYSQVQFISNSRMSLSNFQSLNTFRLLIQAVKRSFIMNILIWAIFCFWTNNKKPNILKWKIKSISKNFNTNIIVTLKQKSMSNSMINLKLNTSTMKGQLKKLLSKIFKKNLIILESTLVIEKTIFQSFWLKRKLISCLFIFSNIYK